MMFRECLLRPANALCDPTEKFLSSETKPVSDQHRRFDPAAVAGSCGKRLNPAEDGFVQACHLAEQ